MRQCACILASVLARLHPRLCLHGVRLIPSVFFSSLPNSIHRCAALTRGTQHPAWVLVRSRTCCCPSNVFFPLVLSPCRGNVTVHVVLWRPSSYLHGVSCEVMSAALNGWLSERRRDVMIALAFSSQPLAPKRFRRLILVARAAVPPSDWAPWFPLSRDSAHCASQRRLRSRPMWRHLVLLLLAVCTRLVCVCVHCDARARSKQARLHHQFRAHTGGP